MNNVNETEQELINEIHKEIELMDEIHKLDTIIEKYEEDIKKGDSNWRLRITDSKKLKGMKEELEECVKKREELGKQVDEVLLKIKEMRLEIKKSRCKTLIGEISTIQTIRDENGNDIEVDEGLKESFIEEIENFMDSDSFDYNYYYEETEDYSISEGLVLTSNNTVDLLTTTNDFGIAAKHHQHYKTIDEMLSKYMKYYDTEKTEKPETAIKQ